LASSFTLSGKIVKIGTANVQRQQAVGARPYANQARQ